MKCAVAALATIVAAVVSAGAVRADIAHAPPTLSPATAQRVATACIPAAAGVDALVRGADAAEIDALAAALARCSALRQSPKLHDDYVVVLAALDVSRGVLRHDDAALARAAEATSPLRGATAATDAQVRTWVVIPDRFDAATGKASFDDFQCSGDVSLNAAYLNLAARTKTAWIEEARTPRGSTACGSLSNATAVHSGIGPNPFARPIPPAPTAAPDNRPPVLGTPHR